MEMIKAKPFYSKFFFLRKIFFLIFISFHSTFGISRALSSFDHHKQPYIIYVRGTFHPFVKAVLGHHPHLSIKPYSASLLSMVVQKRQSKGGPHLIIGLEEEKKKWVKRGKFIPYVKGELALITHQSDKRTLHQWMSTKGLVIGQDPLTSSTGRVFERWAISQGYDHAYLKAFFATQCGSLAGSFLLFAQKKKPAMIGYMCTPLFALRADPPFLLKAIPLNCAEVWGVVITQQGLEDPRTAYLLQDLSSPQAYSLMKTHLLLEPIR